MVVDVGHEGFSAPFFSRCALVDLKFMCVISGQCLKTTNVLCSPFLKQIKQTTLHPCVNFIVSKFVDLPGAPSLPFWTPFLIHLPDSVSIVISFRNSLFSPQTLAAVSASDSLTLPSEKQKFWGNYWLGGDHVQDRIKSLACTYFWHIDHCIIPVCHVSPVLVPH